MDQLHHQWHGQLEIVADFERTAAYLPPLHRSPREHPLFVQVGLRVRNLSAVPLSLHFATAQLLEIELIADDGEVITRLSQGQLYAQVASVRTLDPHRSLYLEGALPLFDEEWAWAPSGNYTIRISLAANMRFGAQGPLRLLAPS